MLAYGGLCFGAEGVLPAQWMHFFGYVYSGPTTPLDKPSGERQIHWIFDIWAKEAFPKPQGSDKGPYWSEILDLRLDCSRMTITTLREVKLGQHDEVVSDVRPAPVEEPIHTAGNIDALPLNQRFAVAELDVTCRGGAD